MPFKMLKIFFFPEKKRVPTLPETLIFLFGLFCFQMSSTFIPCLTTVSQLKHDVESNNVFITKPNEYWQFERKEYCNEQVCHRERRKPQ